MTTVLVACLAGLGVAALLVVVRLVRGPSVPDRVVALDVLVQLVVMGIAVTAACTRDGTYLSVLVAVALLAFVGTVTVGRFVERRGA